MKAIILCLFFLVLSHFAFGQVIFFDDFNSNESYEDTLALNVTSKVYIDNSIKQGHLLKKWNYSWDYDYPTGDWRQAFYCVQVGDSVMTQAGRSACYFGYTNRITAKAELPDSAKHYKITFKQRKVDNDPIFYTVGAMKNGYDGTEFGFENQIPETDQTVDDAYLRGIFGNGVLKENMAFRRKWVRVTIDVDLVRKFVTWKMDDQTMSSGFVRDLKPGGFFGLWHCYDRNSQFDDFKIEILN